MSGVKQYTKADVFNRTAAIYVLASDYDRDTQALSEDRDSHQRVCIAAIEDRDRQSVITGEYIAMNQALRGELDTLRTANQRLEGEVARYKRLYELELSRAQAAESELSRYQIDAALAGKGGE